MSRASRGFTLLEVLVVLSILGIILVMLGQGLRIGIQGSETFRQVTRTQTDIEPLERALRRMIEQMNPGMYPNAPDVQGTAHAIAFTTALPDPDTGGTLTADVRLEARDGQLILWWTPHTAGVPFAAPPPPHRKVLLGDVKELDIAYASHWADSGWLAAWSQQAMPGLVRLRLVPADGAPAWPTIVARPQREQAEE